MILDNEKKMILAFRFVVALAVSKNLVERCGGSIDVASEPGSGTVVTMTLPAAAGSERDGHRTADSVCAGPNRPEEGTDISAGAPTGHGKLVGSPERGGAS